MFTLNTLNSRNQMNNMEKKVYNSPLVTEIKLDSMINVLLVSVQPPVSGMTLEETNETDGSGISQFMNPLKWFR